MALVSPLVRLYICALSLTAAVTLASAVMAEETPVVPIVSAPAPAQAGGMPAPRASHGHSYPAPTALSNELERLAFEGWNRLAGTHSSLARLPKDAPAPDIDRVDANKFALLREFGLSAISQKSFQRGQRHIYVDLFEFENSDGAYATYCLLRRGATTVVKRGDATSEDDDSISFVQGKTFVSIYGTSTEDDESKDVIRLIATKLSKAIPEHGAPPVILTTMPQLELLHGSEKLVMGPLSARRFFPAPYLSALDYKNCKVASVADYQITLPAKERVKLIFFDYGSNVQAAQASYQSYLNELCQSRGEDPAQLFGRPSNQFRNGTTYTNIALKGPHVVLVSGARKKYSADLLLRQIR